MDWTDPAHLAAFFTLHSGLPREGPGDRASAERALALARPLPPRAAVLDIARGPGGQTLDLAELLPDARITALDAHEPFLDDLRRRAAEKGLSDRIDPVLGDMARLPFSPGSFDLLWCEGAAYILGLPAALSAWRPLLRPRGVLALTEPVWLRPDPPAHIRASWAEYALMGSPEAAREVARRAGYRVRGDFVLGAEAWWTSYYAPLEARIGAVDRAGADPATRIVLDEARAEIDTFRHHGDCYGYLFLVLEAEEGPTS